jgi:hypothetical protein
MASNSREQYPSVDQDDAGDVSDSSYIPPDEPLGSHAFGTTAAEQREGEGFDRRSRHTQPEDVDNPGYDPELAGQLVQPGDEDVDMVDEEANVIAIDEERTGSDLSAEEAAMHVVDDRS